MNFKIPTTLAVVISAIAGVIIAFVNSNIIVLEPEWTNGVTIGVTILAVWGISPLTGEAFRAILHLSNGLATAIAMVLASLQVILMQVHMSLGLHGILAGVIVFAGGLGFAPSINVAVLSKARLASLSLVALTVVMGILVVIV